MTPRTHRTGCARFVAPRLLLSFLLALGALVALSAGARAAVGEGGECTTAHMYVVAHEDDTLLFQSPSILQDIESGRCTRSVFITAGDAGKGPVYWHSREEGVEAAYAQMAGVEDEWISSTVVANGHSLLMRTLVGDPRVTVVFMRLPDGNYPAGTGYPMYGNQSLMKLWNGGNGGSPSGPTMTAVDGSNTFDYNGLVNTLTELMQAYEPQQIATQDYTETFAGWDHHDHTAAAYFTRLAQRSYAKPHQLLAFQDYPTLERPQNLSGPLLEEKKSVFYLYGLYDEGACSEEIACEATEYNVWLKRQYVTGRETIGVVADAGYAQTVEPGALVKLSGTSSSTESGKALAYAWTQTAGPTVTLSGAETATPSFVAPRSGTATFSLAVRDGVTWSAADKVNVTVQAASAEPVAVAGAPQTVSAGETVRLDGSGSYNPEGGSLTYKWTQTAGPTVALAGTTVAKPTFTAPGGPAALEFSLTVSSGGRTSAVSTVAVTVATVAGTANDAPSASATASSAAPEQGPELAIDGVISGYPTNPFAEWSSNGERAGAWLQLSWGGSYTLDHVVLYDRPNSDDQITSGHLTFSDGSTVAFGALPNSGSTGLTVSFPARATTSLRVTVDGASSTTLNVGLSELEAWGGPTSAPTAIKPSFTSPATAQFTTGAASTLSVAAAGVPTATLKSSGTLPSGLSFKAAADGTATISGTPAASAAPAGSSKSYAITLTATNSAGSATQTLTITVTNNEPKPTKPAFTSAKTASFTAGSAGSFTAVTTGVPTATLKSSGTLPSGLAFKANADGTATISGTPAASAAPAGSSKSYAITLTATNSAGSATQTLTITVTNNEPKPTKPAFTTSTTRTATVNKAVEIPIEATGVPTPTLSLSGSAPKGLTFKVTAAGKAVLTGTPTATGSYRLPVVATNSAGTTTQTLTLTVSR